MTRLVAIAAGDAIMRRRDVAVASELRDDEEGKWESTIPKR
jgi:hypothetical protein